MQKLRRILSNDFFVVVLIFTVRLILQAFLYHAGFIALTADDFGRTVMAAQWAQAPYCQTCTTWLPFHMYFYGSALRVVEDLIWVPRLLGVSMGLLALLLTYYLGHLLFANRFIAALGAIFMTVSPGHIWLSSTPLTETPYITLYLAFLLGFCLYFKYQKPYFIYLSAASLALLNGIRFEGWAVSGLFSLYLAGKCLYCLWTKEKTFLQILPEFSGLFIPWIFPVFWMTNCYLETGNPLFSPTSTMLYNAKWYGLTRDMSSYLPALFRIDSYLIVLLPFSLVGVWARFRDQKLIKCFFALTVIPVIPFMLLLWGRPEPEANKLRYLAIYMVLFYPLLAWLVHEVASRIGRFLLSKNLLLIAFTFIVIVTQVRAVFQFTNDPVAEGLAVGETIASLRMSQPATAERPVLIELSYWQYLAIHVGANDITNIMYDRERESSRQAVSLLITDPAAIQRCINLHDISYIVVKTPELKSAVEQNFETSSFIEVNGYTFYRVFKRFGPDGEAGTCPLKIE